MDHWIDDGKEKLDPSVGAGRRLSQLYECYFDAALTYGLGPSGSLSECFLQCPPCGLILCAVCLWKRKSARIDIEINVVFKATSLQLSSRLNDFEQWHWKGFSFVCFLSAQTPKRKSLGKYRDASHKVFDNPTERHTSRVGRGALLE